MNGEHQEIIDEIVKLGNKLNVVSLKQDLQHKANKEDIDEIKENVKGLPKLKAQAYFQWFMIATMFAWLFFK